jgi:hypothetical protein
MNIAKAIGDLRWKFLYHFPIGMSRRTINTVGTKTIQDRKMRTIDDIRISNARHGQGVVHR